MKIAYNLETTQFFSLIFFLLSFSLLNCPLPLKKTPKMLKKTLDFAYRKILYIRYDKNAKTLVTWKPFNIFTQFFFLGPFPLLSYPSPLPNHPKCWKKPSYKERRSRQNHVFAESQSFKRANSNFGKDLFSGDPLFQSKHQEEGLRAKKRLRSYYLCWFLSVCSLKKADTVFLRFNLDRSSEGFGRPDSWFIDINPRSCKVNALWFEIKQSY